MITTQLICKVNFFGYKNRIGNHIHSPKITQLRKATVMKSSDISSLATTYAAALINLSEDKNILEQVNTDVNAVLRLIAKEDGLKEFLSNPAVTEDKKFKLLDSICEQAEFSKYTVNFLKLLVERGRMENISEILQAFDLEYCRITDTQIAFLRTAVKMQTDQEMSLAKKVKDLCGAKNIRLVTIIDETLIAGFVIQYGSNQIDMSVKGQLDQITNQLTQVASNGSLF